MSGDFKTRIGGCRYLIVSAMFLLVPALLQLHAQSAKGNSSETSIRPVLVNTCMVTERAMRIVEFYEPILQQKAKWSGDDYAEFATGVGVLRSFPPRNRKSTFLEELKGQRTEALFWNSKLSMWMLNTGA